VAPPQGRGVHNIRRLARYPRRAPFCRCADPLHQGLIQCLQHRGSALIQHPVLFLSNDGRVGAVWRFRKAQWISRMVRNLNTTNQRLVCRTIDRFSAARTDSPLLRRGGKAMLPRDGPGENSPIYEHATPTLAAGPDEWPTLKMVKGRGKRGVLDFTGLRRTTVFLGMWNQ